MSYLKTIGVFALALALVAQFGCSHKQDLRFENPASGMLVYRIEVVYGNSRAFRVTMRFQGDASGVTRLRLPNEWAGMSELYKGLHQIEVTSPGGVLEDSDKPHIKRVRHLPNQAIELRYEVRQHFTERLGANIQSWPTLEKDYFYFTGHGFFIEPDWDVNTPREISLRWVNIPKAWQLANSFGVNELTQDIHASTLEKLNYGLFVGGDFRLFRHEHQGKAYYIATRSAWKFTDDQLNQALSAVVVTHRDFWNDHDDPYFLMLVMPICEGCGRSIGGEGYTNALVALHPAGGDLDEALRLIFWHELGHRWIGMQIKPEEQANELYRWFYEGFTEYYAHLLMLRSRQYSLADYVANYNRTLWAYYMSSIREASNERIRAEMWKNAEMAFLPYKRGEILAHDWNARIMKVSAGRYSLDDVMHVFLKEGRQNKTFDFKTIRRLFKPFLRADLKAELEQYVDRGALLKPLPDALGPCVRLKKDKANAFDLGFDLKRLQASGVISGVRAGSSAYKAGLRNGQRPKFMTYDNIGKSTEQTVVITVAGQSGPVKISYQPRGDSLVRVPQYVIDRSEYKGDPERCRRWFKAL